MEYGINIANATMELIDCRDKWTFDDRYDCWCLEDVLYSPKADAPAFQRLSIYAPKPYMNENGTLNPDGEMCGYTAATAPVLFETNAAGYMQMPHKWLGGPRCDGEKYIKRGMIYVTAGCRGRESRNAAGEPVGKAPVTLIDTKMAVRFLRHNRAALPGDWDRVISCGVSAGGAMSALLGVTGDHPDYDANLREAGAFMDESDAMFASQIYCPIIDLEHADLAYEWCFGADAACEDSPAGPAETMTPFKAALSKKLAARYVDYANGLNLRHPRTGEALTLNPDGRSGGFYDYLMNLLNESAAKFLRKKGGGAADYLAGNYTYESPAKPPKQDNPDMHHVGPNAGGVEASDKPRTIGEMMLRPPKGVPFREMELPMETRRGTDKRGGLKWDGERAEIAGLDTYVLSHRRRMKPCTAFDKLTNDSGENDVFGDAAHASRHFDAQIGAAIGELAADFPAEAALYKPGYDEIADDAALMERIRIFNPMNYIDDAGGRKSRFFRIRVGASDADTAFTISMALALRLENAGNSVDYALVWDQPHCDADYPGEVLDWIDGICQ